MIKSYGHVFIYRYVFEILKWEKVIIQTIIIFKYNIILQCIYNICKCEECSISGNKTPELTKVPFHMNFYRWIILRLFIKFTQICS